MLLALISTFVITPLFLRYVRLITVWDILSVDLKLDVVNNCALFAGMKKWQVRKIIALSEIRDFRQDEAILLQGKSMEHLYIPLEGQIESWRTDKDGSAHLIGMIYPGNVFGALTPQKNQMSSGDMVAITPVRLMLLKSKDIQNISRMYPRLAVKLLKNLCAIVGNILSNEEVKSPQIYDDYSGAYSATIFTEILGYIIDRAQRYNEPLTMIVVDLGLTTDFYNDDKSISRNQLISVADVIQAQLRKPDIFGLWHDGSYWIALPQTDAVGAELIVNRLLANLERIHTNDSNSLNMSVTFSTLEQADSLNDLVVRIDLDRSQQQLINPYPVTYS